VDTLLLISISGKNELSIFNPLFEGLCIVTEHSFPQVTTFPSHFLSFRIIEPDTILTKSFVCDIVACDDLFVSGFETLKTIVLYADYGVPYEFPSLSTCVITLDCSHV